MCHLFGLARTEIRENPQRKLFSPKCIELCVNLLFCNDSSRIGCMFGRLRKTISDRNRSMCLCLSHGILKILNGSIGIVSKAEVSTSTTGVFKIRYKRPMRHKLFLRKLSSRIDRCAGMLGIEKAGEFTIHSSDKCTLTMKIEVLEWNERANKLLANGTWPESAVSHRWTSHRWERIREERFFRTRNACTTRLYLELELTSWCVDCIIYWIRRMPCRLLWPCRRSYTEICEIHMKSSLRFYFVYN